MIDEWYNEQAIRQKLIEIVFFLQDLYVIQQGSD